MKKFKRKAPGQKKKKKIIPKAEIKTKNICCCSSRIF